MNGLHFGFAIQTAIFSAGAAEKSGAEQDQVTTASGSFRLKLRVSEVKSRSS